MHGQTPPFYDLVWRNVTITLTPGNTKTGVSEFSSGGPLGVLQVPSGGGPQYSA